MSTPSEKIARVTSLSFAFTPAAPVDDTQLFSGRSEQVMTCTSALFQRGVHIGVYGERGVGKTSLANVLPKLINAAGASTATGLSAVRVDCNGADGFSSLWRRILREIDHTAPELPDREMNPEGIRFYLQRSTATRLVVLDELDRLEDAETLSLLADTMKTLADHHVSVTLMLVGVAQSLDHLVGEHESIVRSLVQVPMPRMSKPEMEDILGRGLPQVPLAIETAARDSIVTMAEGLPHFVHLLALHAGTLAIEDDRDTVTVADVERAIGVAAKTHTMGSAYTRAVRSNQRANLYQQVLLACAFAHKTDGWFRASDVKGPLTKILGRDTTIQGYARHIEEFSTDDRGNTLTKNGTPRRFRYRFKDPLLQPFVKMVALDRCIVNPTTFEQLEAAYPTSVGLIPEDPGWPTDATPGFPS